jgi:hypothetical protein
MVAPADRLKPARGSGKGAKQNRHKGHRGSESYSCQHR